MEKEDWDKIKYFNKSEFKCRCGECDGGIMNKDLIYKLEDLRKQIRRPIVVTSGFRCTDYNRKIGGSRSSKHLTGRAVDFSIAGFNSSEKYNVIKEIMDIGFNGIGIGKTFIHVDTRPHEKKLWDYYGTDK